MIKVYWYHQSNDWNFNKIEQVQNTINQYDNVTVINTKYDLFMLCIKMEICKSPRNFLTIPCKELAIVLMFCIVNDVQELLHWELFGEKLVSTNISLEWPRQICIHCAWVQKNACNWVFLPCKLNWNSFGHCMHQDKQHYLAHEFNKTNLSIQIILESDSRLCQFSSFFQLKKILWIFVVLSIASFTERGKETFTQPLQGPANLSKRVSL